MAKPMFEQLESREMFAPIIGLNLETPNVDVGAQSFVNFHINANGSSVVSHSAKLEYSNSNLRLDSANILGGDFWDSKLLDPLSSVNGGSWNSVLLKTRTYSNGIKDSGDSFRVYFTPLSQGDYTINISYADMVTKNSNGTSTYFDTDGAYLPFDSNSVYSVVVHATQPVPEPSTMAMLGLGGLAFGTGLLMQKRRNKSGLVEAVASK